MRALAPALTCLLLSGCPSTPDCSVQPVSTVPEERTSWADDSGPTLVAFSAQANFACSGDGPGAESVTGQVLSPSNASIPVKVEPEFEPGTGRMAGARLIFTPTEGPGTYLVTATFLPVGGRPSQPKLVVDDRRKEPFKAFPRACSAVARLPSGSWACDGVLYREDGGTEQLFPAGWNTTAVGNTLWAHQGNTLRAWQVDAGEVRPLGEYATGYAQRLLALEDQLVLFGAAGTQRVSAADGGLRLEGSLNVDAPGKVMSVREGRLYVADEQPFSDALTGAFAHQVCSWTLASGNAPPDACTQLKGVVVGGWDGTFLTHAPEANALRAWAPGPGGGLLLVDTLALPLDLSVLDAPDALFAGGWPQLTDSSGAALVAVVRGGKITVEHLSPMPGGFTSQQDATWGQLEDGGTAAWPTLP
jgi:hypothetical protein